MGKASLRKGIGSGSKNPSGDFRLGQTHPKWQERDGVRLEEGHSFGFPRGEGNREATLRPVDKPHRGSLPHRGSGG